MTYKKLASVKVMSTTQSGIPALVYQVPENKEVIISKVYIHNLQGNTDIRVHVFFVDPSNSNEYDANNNTIDEESTRAFDILIPSLDTAIFGSGVTLANKQSIYVRSIGGDAVVHVFGKIVDKQPSI